MKHWPHIGIFAEVDIFTEEMDALRRWKEKFSLSRHDSSGRSSSGNSYFYKTYVHGKMHDFRAPSGALITQMLRSSGSFQIIESEPNPPQPDAHFISMGEDAPEKQKILADYNCKFYYDVLFERANPRSVIECLDALQEIIHVCLNDDHTSGLLIDPSAYHRMSRLEKERFVQDAAM